MLLNFNIFISIIQFQNLNQVLFYLIYQLLTLINLLFQYLQNKLFFQMQYFIILILNSLIIIHIFISLKKYIYLLLLFFNITSPWLFYISTRYNFNRFIEMLNILIYRLWLYNFLLNWLY